jgi:hypothetical protein
MTSEPTTHDGQGERKREALCSACGNRYAGDYCPKCGQDPEERVGEAISDLVSREAANRWAHNSLAQTEGEVRLAETVAALYDRLSEAIDDRNRAKFMPIGDNHHNGLMCPYCNPDRDSWESLKARIAELEAAMLQHPNLNLSATVGYDAGKQAGLERAAEIVDRMPPGSPTGGGDFDEWTMDEIAAAIRAEIGAEP